MDFSKLFIVSWDTISAFSNAGLVVLGIFSIVYVRKEYFLKRRPFITIHLANEIKDKNWFFYLVLVNKGTYTSVARIKKVLLKIGDEKYPTDFDIDIVLTPNEEQKIAPIGHINDVGRNKVLGHEYKNNRVEITAVVVSKSIGDKKFKYESHFDYQVDISGERPIFSIIKEEIS